MNYNTIISERQDRGEVITPTPLVEEMLDKLPKEVFESKTTTFLDPCFGTGTFLKAIGLRLKSYGHSTENINSRLFGFEVDSRMFNETKRKFQGINIVKQDFLNTNIDMKFDVIVGNPPYQYPKNKNGKSSGLAGLSGKGSMYIDFIKKSIDTLVPNGLLIYITPPGYLKPTDAFKHSKSYKKLCNKQIVLIETNQEIHFKNVGKKVGTPISMVLIKNKIYSDPTTLNGFDVNFNKTFFMLTDNNPIAYSIINKLFNTKGQKMNWLRSKKDLPENKIRIQRMLQSGSNGEWKPTLNIESHIKNPKLEFVICENLDGDRLLNLFNHKILKLFRKLTFIEPTVYHNLLSGLIYPDTMLFDASNAYEAYNLTQEEIDYVENAIK